MSVYITVVRAQLKKADSLEENQRPTTQSTSRCRHMVSPSGPSAIGHTSTRRTQRNSSQLIPGRTWKDRNNSLAIPS